MQRRDFLKKSGLFSAGALALSHTDLLAHAPAKLIKPFGVQLYSVRDILPKDPKGVMTQLAQMGYQQFESYGGKDGFLWGLSPAEMKAFLKQIGVDMVSTHFDFRKAMKSPDQLQKDIDDARGAGLKYLLCPYIGPQKSVDEWKRIADAFNKAGEQARKSGMRFGYHNHDYSFKPIDNQLPQEILLSNTDPKNVVFELDLCWIDVAGVNTESHLKKWKGRYELCHIKDYKKVDGKPHQNDLGQGHVDFKKLLRVAMDNGMKYFIVEQEEYPGDILASMKKDAEYMKKLSV